MQMKIFLEGKNDRVGRRKEAVDDSYLCDACWLPDLGLVCIFILLNCWILSVADLEQIASVAMS